MSVNNISDELYADRIGQKPRLLSGKFSFCSHGAGYWYQTSHAVSDESGHYIRLVGDCKGWCKQPLEVILKPV